MISVNDMFFSFKIFLFRLSVQHDHGGSMTGNYCAFNPSPPLEGKAQLLHYCNLLIVAGKKHTVHREKKGQHCNNNSPSNFFAGKDNLNRQHNKLQYYITAVCQLSRKKTTAHRKKG
jgi:hypothetical protein